MVTAVGVDPGTKSMDIFGFDDETGEVIIDLALPRLEVTKDPKIVLDAIREIDRDIDAIIGPSGYGLPMVKASEVTDAEINAATFITKADAEKRLNIVGLRGLMFLMKKSNLNIWFSPGVIHLPTVPEHRKINKIDMGTADKVFTAVSGIKDQAERYDIDYSRTSFIILEIGFGYTAALGVVKGKIVDGVGGTMGGVGYMGMGAMDGELAYTLANMSADFSKMMLFKGGAVSISQIDPHKVSIEEFIGLARGSEQSPYRACGKAPPVNPFRVFGDVGGAHDAGARAEPVMGQSPTVKLAYSAMLESIIKDTYLLLSSVRTPKELLLSGRFARIDPFVQDVTSILHNHLGELGINAEIRTLKRTGGNVKEAAEGAAIIANGIAGGKYESLIENMELRKSSGGVFSHIYLDTEVGERIEETFAR